jgi:hypothetical protein
MKMIIKIITITFMLTSVLISQTRQYEIHKRGMLHETIFNTGEIGRGYHQGQAGNATSVPLMEWPGNSNVSVDKIQYDGQHNLLGGGVYIAADAADTTTRLYAFCGAVGSSAPEIVIGTWAFPIFISRTENYPVLPDGNLNPAYNPDEAEEIIVSKWSTPTGITVTRTSRAWSFPDYDDFIIYEYEFENTGNRDANTETIESQAKLSDVIISFTYGFAPSMFGHQRTYNSWEYANYERKDQRARFDPSRWLNYNIDMNGKPDPVYFDLWAKTRMNGGGLTSPQAVGFSMLHIDTEHLAKPGETKAVMSVTDSIRAWDPITLRLKQPWVNRLETSNLRSSKLNTQYLDVNPRKNLIISKAYPYGADWVGRGSFNHRQTRKAVGRIMMLGPYVMKIGDKVRFSLAEVVGYGAARLEETRAGLKDQGGSCGEDCGEPTDSAFYPVPNWSETVTYGGFNNLAFTYGYAYLKSPYLDSTKNAVRYNLPDYVNSNVITIREVADRAKQVYTGDTLPPPYWPEKFPERGVYKIPIPIPAPSIKISNTDLAENDISWGPQVESFSAPRLRGAFSHYEVYKANNPTGPWLKIDSIAKNDPRYFRDGIYKLIDTATRVGESFYYSILSVDLNGNKSGRTNITLHQTQLGSTNQLEKVYAVPNPFFIRSGFTGTTADGSDASDKIGFYNLPKRCVIRVYSYSGQLIQTIYHDSELYSTEWLQVTRNNQFIASGLYFFVVQTPDGKSTHGKFVVIH